MQNRTIDWNRRIFLKNAGTVAATVGLPRGTFAPPKSSVAILIDPADTVAASRPAAWALEQLLQMLKSKGVPAVRLVRLEDAARDSFVIAAMSAGSVLATEILKDSRANVDLPEALGIVAGMHGGRQVLLACGYDPRGLVYALSELTDVIQAAVEPVVALAAVETQVEKPANRVRSWTRLFCSDVEDKPWFNDRAMWPKYFDMLAANRFNRFNLAFGIGYDFIRQVTDAYFLYTYPFLLDVPGYKVRVPQLADAERDRNLEMLRYISEQCVMRGLEFHVGLWMHGYVWIDSPHPSYTIEGLDKESHGSYCRDAVRLLLQKVPNIQGLTFRIHGESGVEEGSFDFWKMVFEGVATCGRVVPIDMHAKGMSHEMLDIAVATKQPVQVTPKFWAEHMGMAYQPTDIRDEEKPKAVDAKGLMALSTGTRSFLRYSYGDLLAEDRKWTVVYRIWPGTQRVLLWADPVFAAAYSRAFSFCGSDGVEVQEPLSFKGRRGSGHAGNRCAYADSAYSPRWDWQKYEYGTRLWGRMLYNPEAKPEVWRRSLVQQFGAGSAGVEAALSHASRILPVITTAYAPSAGNNSYWPEIYWNESLVDSEHWGPYMDSPKPRVFGTASPLDPRIFLSMNDAADELLSGKSSGKYSPIEVAQWIEDYAAAARKGLADAQKSGSGRGTAAYRRAAIDVEMQAGIGDFFGARFRSAVLFHLYQLTGAMSALDAAVVQYRKAKTAWSMLAEVGKVYMTDITLGELPFLRGHWRDRLPAIDRDIAALEELRASDAPEEPSPRLAAAVQAALGRPQRQPLQARHIAPQRFMRGKVLG